MILNSLFRPGRKALLLITGVGVFLLAMFSTSLLLKLFYTSNARTNGGFDFAANLSEDGSGNGPEIGERINIALLEDSDGTTLANAINSQFTIVTIVDPACGACRVASDQMRDIRDRVVPAGVQYCFVSVTTRQKQQDFAKYIRSLGISAPAYLWATDKPPVDALYTVVLPSHILIDRNGVVIRKWLGTDKRKEVRARMANQIVSDTLAELSH
ncbi:MAG TPA: hypothetical protein VJT09_16700 [Pyrinomonadaceae bacterium]|nr:hypothetical protein [Pyrinomonadaceae bacterium]